MRASIDHLKKTKNKKKTKEVSHYLTVRYEQQACILESQSTARMPATDIVIKSQQCQPPHSLITGFI